MRNIKNIAILGSTGSIGTQTLDVISEYSDRLYPYLLTANHNSELLISQALKYKPRKVVIADVSHFVAVREALAGTGIEVVAGADAIAESVADTEIDIVVTALVGYSGLAPTIRAINAGKKIALANKETLVVAGELITGMLKDSVSELIPVDSEHSAIFQCLVGEDVESVEKLILTASGGPFRTMSVAEMSKVTKADALNHPNWKMGAKVTVDSASMMNKGFEMIEARWLFNIVPDRIEIVVHPQSIVHSMVEFSDGSIKAQLGLPDMRLPIRYALNYPERLQSKAERLTVDRYSSLTFEKPDMQKFPLLGMAFDAIRAGGNVPCALNAANEIAVAAFLSDKIRFVDMPVVVGKAVARNSFVANPSYDDLIATNKDIREITLSLIK
ncbi:MAG: 1-deoxy-D-xylulose-5-phosphate reductoisomerase [Bacteroidetes bacterium]|uniref:1-deoxy-D-xylulose 5-phosphate reductoisomerase n=1 Tax=Candidatus Limisoma faecipullorum TaxID=2840854 RepID=A0A9D9NJQ4_9BACT|nr:1-deoxy-D-xylulose-5-phosphate reductoisomerase [Candidatus Limisoma faecipullorum]